MTMHVPKNTDEEFALAQEMATLDGKRTDFLAGKDKPVVEQPGGHYAGYMVEAKYILDRLREKGYRLMKE